MNDKDLLANVIAVLQTGLTAQAVQVAIQSAYQNETVAVPTGPCIFIYDLGDVPYGMPTQIDTWDAVNKVKSHTETQIFTTTFQISALAKQDPADDVGPTAKDYVRAARFALQNQYARQTLQALAISVLRVGEVRNTQITDDGNDYEANPSFDFKVMRTESMTVSQPSTTEVVAKITALG